MLVIYGRQHAWWNSSHHSCHLLHTSTQNMFLPASESPLGHWLLPSLQPPLIPSPNHYFVVFLNANDVESCSRLQFSTVQTPHHDLQDPEWPDFQLNCLLSSQIPLPVSATLLIPRESVHIAKVLRPPGMCALSSCSLELSLVSLLSSCQLVHGLSS